VVSRCFVVANMSPAALQGEDDECLRIMAEEFQNPRAGLMNHIFWKDLDDKMPSHHRKSETTNNPPVPECLVM